MPGFRNPGLIAAPIALAITSGCTIGATGRGCLGMCVRALSNWGVLTAGSSTIVILMLLPACKSSLRNEPVIPPRYAKADPTWMMWPRLRGRMEASAAMVPCTAPR